MATIDLTDSVLLAKLQEGDYATFDEFYAKYWKPLYRVAFRILKDEHASEDVVQDTFVRFWENRNTIENTNIKGWLSTTSYRLILKCLKKQEATDSLDTIAFKEPLADDVDQLMYVRQLQVQIDNCVQTLPDQCRKVYTMSRHNNLSVKNIADELGISPKTVEGHLTLALKRIRASLHIPLLLLLLLK